jgi:hypothetical protein
MKDVITAVAQVFALENAASLDVRAGVACDVTNPVLVRLAGDLSERLESVGIDLQALWLEGETLVARIDESQAEEPLCPFAFQGVVRKLAYALTGEVWNARIEAATPAVTKLTPAA